MNIVECPECGNENKDNDSSCDICGNALPDTRQSSDTIELDRKPAANERVGTLKPSSLSTLVEASALTNSPVIESLVDKNESMLALKAKIEHVAQSVPKSVLNTKNIFNNATSNLKIEVSVMSRPGGGFSSSIVFMSNNDSLGSTVEVELREAFRDKFREDHLNMLGKGKLEMYSVVHRTFEKVAKEKDFLARVVKNREDEIAKVAYRNDPSLRPLFERREVKSEEIEFDVKENILMEKEEVVLPTVEDMNVVQGALTGCNVVVTGFVPDEKKKMEDMVTDFNGTVSETVTQTTSFVLTGPEPSRTKIAAAKTSNILLVSLPTVIKVLTGEIKLDEMKHQLPPNIIRYGLSKSNFRKPSTNANASSDAEKENNTPNQINKQSNLVTDAKSVARASFGMEDLSDMELDEESSNPDDRKRKSDVLDKQAAFNSRIGVKSNPASASNTIRVSSNIRPEDCSAPL